MLFRENPLGVEYSIKEEALYCRQTAFTVRITPAGAWQRKSFGDWQAILFAFDLLELELTAQPKTLLRLPCQRQRS